MKSKEVIRYVAEETGIPQKSVKAVLESYSRLVQEKVADGSTEHVPLSDLGRFKIVERKTRNIYNPQTGERLSVHYGKLRFSPSQKVKQLLK